MTFGPACCESVAAAMIGHFTTRLEVEARKAGGTLSAEAIRAIAERFTAHEQARFAPVFQRAYDECTRRREARHWDSARRRPFDRILMKRFAHLFPPRPGDDGGERADRPILSRRAIPGFNMAVHKMIGPSLHEQCQSKCQAILDRHRLAGGGFDWVRIYADAETVALANDVLVVIAHYFADFDRRRAWFVDLVNSRLARSDEGDDEAWRLSEYSFAAWMAALFDSLRATMRMEAQSVRRRYGDQAFRQLEKFFRRLDRA